MSAPQNSLLLYASTSASSLKVTLALEELKQVGALDYDVRIMQLGRTETKEPWYLKINPNGKVPVLVDRSRDDFVVFESAAISLYLQDVYDKESVFHFKDNLNLQSEMIQWIFNVNTEIIPMQGLCHYLGKDPNANSAPLLKEAVMKVERQYVIIEQRLEGRDFLAGDGKGKYTWADMDAFAWIRSHLKVGIDINKYPNIKAWMDRINARPATPRALLVGPANMKDPIANMTPEDIEKYVANIRKWTE